MENMIDVISEEIKREISNGDWISVPVEDGHYEGSLQTLEIENVEIDNWNLEDEDLEVVVIGVGDVVYKDHNSEEKVEQDVEVSVTSNISIQIGNYNPKDHSVIVTVNAKIIGASRRS